MRRAGSEIRWDPPPNLTHVRSLLCHGFGAATPWACASALDAPLDVAARWGTLDCLYDDIEAV